MAKAILTGNSGLMRDINKNVITNIILQNEPISRSEIAQKASLAMPTVMRIVDSLIEEGLVVEGGKGESSGGRKPILLEINPRSSYFIGIEIARKTTTILTDIRGNIIAINKEKTIYNNGSEVILNQIKDGIDKVIESSGVEKNKIGGIGLGTPGTKFKYGDVLREYPFSSWAELDLDNWLKDDKFDYPIVWENLSKVGALGELLFGKEKGQKDFLYVFADNGIGLGIVLNGELFTGVDGVAGEFGHTIIQPNGKTCYCGNSGCLEMYTSIPSMIKQAKLQSKNSATSILNKYDENLDFSVLLSALEQGDELAKNVVCQAGEMLGIGIANLINLFNPDAVVIGGEIGSSCIEYVRAAEKSAKSNVFSKAAQNTVITASGLKDNGAALGAAALAISKVFKNPIA